MWPSAVVFARDQMPVGAPLDGNARGLRALFVHAKIDRCSTTLPSLSPRRSLSVCAAGVVAGAFALMENAPSNVFCGGHDSVARPGATCYR